jgi:thymidylate synthase ThyX
MKKITAEIIADSLAPNGSRCTTFVLTFPRIVLAEFNTHRAISKNSASSRAIPFEKMKQMVLEEPFMPIAWMKNHKGMQGTEYVEDQQEINSLVKDWLYARDKAVQAATSLYDKGLTKQICNRLLEPFMWHTVIATGTEWENFFALRAHDQAEIHIQQLAYEMLQVYNDSTPKQLRVGGWHIPFGDKLETPRLLNLLGDKTNSTEYEKAKVKIATARCARVSYLNFEGKDDYEADLKLHDILSTSGHWSPFEHCAMADTSFGGNRFIGNFRGFVQYRKQFNNENQSDNRVELKMRDLKNGRL